jgi:hypothetical protein
VTVDRSDVRAWSRCGSDLRDPSLFQSGADRVDLQQEDAQSVGSCHHRAVAFVDGKVNDWSAWQGEAQGMPFWFVLISRFQFPKLKE